MEKETPVIVEPSVGMQLARMLISATAAFLAGKMAEKTFDKVVAIRSNTADQV